MATRTETTESELPPAQRHIIKRPRLTRLLDEAEARVILLVAPAGYGKTTLAREWLKARRGAGTWIRLWPQCKDAPVLASTLARHLFPSTSKNDALPRLEGAFAAGATPDELAGILLEAVGDDSRLVVLDDHHVLDGSGDAERVMARFIRASKLQVLITSRSRPSWVRARDLLYGAIAEIDRAKLAMDLAEAHELMPSRAPKEISELVATSRGWPAVLGLSALVGRAQPHAKAPEALYDYFAQELLANLDRHERTAFALLSLLDRIDDDIAEAVVGSGAAELLQRGRRLGILTSPTREEVEIHPLLRRFLHERNARDLSDESVRTVFHELVRRRRWDEAFALVSSRSLEGEIAMLMVAGVESALRDGRLTTLQRWTSWSRRRGLDFPQLLYTEAELAIRRGDHVLAESLAVNAAADLNGRMRTLALLCAGTSAHMRDDNQVAYEFFALARAEATDLDLQREALWGLVLAAVELPDKDPLPLVNEYEQLPNRTPAHILRVHQGRLLVVGRTGGLREVVDSALSAVPLVDAVADPFIRTAFLHALAHDCAIAGRYSLAKDIAERTIAESRRSRLAFVIPHALLDLGLAQLGSGEATAAEASVLKASTDPHGRHDSHLQAYCCVVAARIELTRGNALKALELCEPVLQDPPRTFVTSEVNATAALAAAAADNAGLARQHLSNLSERASSPESQGYAATTRFLLTIIERGDVRSAAATYVQEIGRSGALDSVLIALRADKRFGDALLKHEREWTVRLVETLEDRALGHQLGVSLRPRQQGSGRLSTREQEILDLVAEGLTSREIGAKLFISEKTVKAHLARIYGKLGVRSRTQAVTKARELLRGA